MLGQDQIHFERKKGRVATPEAQLASFIAKYTPEIAALAEAVLNRMRMLYPTAVEIVYDNYNALAIGFGPSDRASEVIFSITIYPKWVSLFFMQAKGLSDHYGLLKGSGSVARHVVLKSLHMLDDGALQALMDDACAKAKLPLNAEGKHRLLIKSVSEKQRSRRPA
jgi:hypothetical protein